MSISPNVGALNNYLTRILSNHFITAFRKKTGEILKHVPQIFEIAKRTERQVKGMLAPPGNLFEELGFTYWGPVDGHDIETLLSTLQNLRAMSGPRLLHVITHKGQGYDRAEDNPIKYHGVSSFDPSRGIRASGKPAAPTYSEVFGRWICDMAEKDAKLVGITPAMREGSLSLMGYHM